MSKKPQRDPTKTIRLSGPPAAGEEVPPVVIKGGSLKLEFKDVDFDSDADAQKKIRLASHPNSNIKILRVEIRDNRTGEKDKLLSFYDATDVAGRIDIIVFAQ